MTVELLEKGLRRYRITCDVCLDKYSVRTKNKITLRDGLRDNDWSWRDVGILGLVDCTCPECMKRRKSNGDQ